MVVVPLPPYVVHSVFQYILPPNLPLPPHLLSNRLIERHHFLSISHTDPNSYLCWPSSDTAEVVEALENAHSQDAFELNHEVRYTAADEETLLAHVRPDSQSPLQIVFAWDNRTETWRYHDARLIPFPEHSHPSLDVTISNRTKSSLGSNRLNRTSHRSRSASPASDNYWAGYESSGSSPDTAALPSTLVADDDDRAEAAYWASYSVVQGSGDSTMPSPKRRSIREGPPLDSRGPETTFDPFVANLHLRLNQEDGSLSPRFAESDGWVSPRPVNEAELHTDEKYGEIQIKPQEKLEETSVYHNVMEVELFDPGSTGVSCRDEVCSMNGVKINKKKDDQADEGVKEAIRGIYHMWKAQSGKADVSDFIDIVKSAIV